MQTENIIITYAQGLDHDPCHQVFLKSVADHASARLIITPATDRPGQVVHTRWKPILETLSGLPPESRVLLLDSRDVVLTRDPFPELLPLGDLLFFSEGQLTNDHPWTRAQYMLLQRQLRLPVSVHLQRPEVNGGCVYGTAANLIPVAAHMAEKAELYAATEISDQPVLNMLVKNRYAGMVVSDPALYAHGELVRMGRWKHDPLEAAIYHQFDRVCEHKLMFIAALRGEPVIRKVVSRYKERPDAHRKILPSIPCTVYCKGPDPLPGEIRLPNVGFEAHTWLEHFHRNYHKLPPITLCLQGDPAPHCRIRNDQLLATLLAADPDDFWFMPFTFHGALQDRNGGPHHKGLSELRVLWKELLGYPCPHNYHAFYGGQFAVHRDAVRSRPREAYAKAAGLIRTKNDACAMERMWQHWFCH